MWWLFERETTFGKVVGCESNQTAPIVEDRDTLSYHKSDRAVALCVASLASNVVGVRRASEPLFAY